ncbi:MAG: TerB family tellurite resistance protein [Rhizobiales bacterium]|nr:TerB family tellurite resistance protein [Hyphomicrobiales bacterium]
MFQQIKAFLNNLTGHDDAPHFKDTDPRLAAAALLVHTISIDGIIAEEEKVKLQGVLKRKYQLSDEDTSELIDEANAADKEAVDLYSFTRILKRNLDEEERLDILAMIWDLVYADGVVHEFEDNLVWRIAELLGISTRDRMIMKKRAEKLSR